VLNLWLSGLGSAAFRAAMTAISDAEKTILAKAA
jgi:hypothetical protein